MAFTHKGKTYTIPGRSDPGRSTLTIDRMAEFKVMGGVREILVPQFRTDDEMMATLSGHEQNLVRADVLSLPVDPFPFEIVQMSREAARDPRIEDKTIEVGQVGTIKLAPLTPHRYKTNGELETYILCSACNEFLLPNAFSADSTRANGRRYICKGCDNQKRVTRRRLARIGKAA